MATVLAVLLAVNLPKSFIKIYIGVLVLVMGVVLLSKFNLSSHGRKCWA